MDNIGWIDCAGWSFEVKIRKGWADFKLAGQLLWDCSNQMYLLRLLLQVETVFCGVVLKVCIGEGETHWPVASTTSQCVNRKHHLAIVPLPTSMMPCQTEIQVWFCPAVWWEMSAMITPFQRRRNHIWLVMQSIYLLHDLSVKAFTHRIIPSRHTSHFC